MLAKNQTYRYAQNVNCTAVYVTQKPFHVFICKTSNSWKGFASSLGSNLVFLQKLTNLQP